MRKIALIALLVFLILGTTAGCANSTDQSANGSSNKDKKVTLKFSFWGNETHKQMYEDLFKKFEETHKNINVEIITIPFAKYQQKLSIMAASNTAPDIAWLADRMIPQFLTSDQLVDVSSQLKSDSNYNFDDFYPATLNLFQQNDKLYGVPFSTPPMILYYNKTLFEKSGLKTPSELYDEGQWDYQHFIDAAKKITDQNNGVYGVKLVREWENWSDALMPVIWSFGGKLFNDDKTKFILNSPEGEKALQTYDDLIFKDKVHPKPGDQMTFETGKLGMFTDRYSYVSSASKIKDFEWGIAPLPEGPAGRITSIGYAGYTVFKGSKHQKEAIELLKFLTNKDSMTKTSTYFVPARKSILSSDIFKNQAPEAIRSEIDSAVLKQMDNSLTSPYHPNWEKIDVTMQKLLDQLYTQSSSVKDVLKQMETQVQPLMK